MHTAPVVRSVGALALLGLALGCPDGDGNPGDEDSDTAEDQSLDPLSMPAEPTLSLSDFNSADDCASCHPTHVREWGLSRHGFAMQDPVFRALTMLRQQDQGGFDDQFCTSCHSSLCTRGGDCIPGYSFDSLSPISLEGVTCEACHKVQSVQRPYNSGHILDGEAALGGPIADPAPNTYHASTHESLFEHSEFCAGCHDVLETNGLNLERPYAEWIESPAATSGKQCQSCHMPRYEGAAALGGPQRELHRHHFVAVELPLSPELDADPELKAELDAEIDALLRTAASLELELPDRISPGQQLDLVATVHNRIDAHNFPTGTTNLRQVWVEITATDAEGTVLYRTGHLDDNGDLGNVWSTITPFFDPDLLLLSSTLIDRNGQPTVFPWQATEHRSGSIQPLKERTFTLFVPIPQDAVGPIQVEGVVHFRTYPPFLIEVLGLTETMRDSLEVRDVAEASATVALE